MPPKGVKLTKEKYNEIKKALEEFGINNVERSMIEITDVKPLGPKPELPSRLIYNINFG